MQNRAKTYSLWRCDSKIVGPRVALTGGLFLSGGGVKVLGQAEEVATFLRVGTFGLKEGRLACHKHDDSDEESFSAIYKAIIEKSVKCIPGALRQEHDD